VIGDVGGEEREEDEEAVDEDVVVRDRDGESLTVADCEARSWACCEKSFTREVYRAISATYIIISHLPCIMKRSFENILL
jgi:hypothetical protein